MFCGDRFVETDNGKKTYKIAANSLYGFSTSDFLPHEGIQFSRNVDLEGILGSIFLNLNRHF